MTVHLIFIAIVLCIAQSYPLSVLYCVIEQVFESWPFPFSSPHSKLILNVFCLCGTL